MILIPALIEEVDAARTFRKLEAQTQTLNHRGHGGTQGKPTQGYFVSLVVYAFMV